MTFYRILSNYFLFFFIHRVDSVISHFVFIVRLQGENNDILKGKKKQWDQLCTFMGSCWGSQFCFLFIFSFACYKPCSLFPYFTTCIGGCSMGSEYLQPLLLLLRLLMLTILHWFFKDLNKYLRLIVIQNHFPLTSKVIEGHTGGLCDHMYFWTNVQFDWDI